MVGDLEQIDPAVVGDPGRDQPRIDVVLHVAHQQEPARPEAQVQHDRRVVHRATIVRGAGRDRATQRPPGQDGHAVEVQRVTRGQPGREPGIGPEVIAERGIARPGAEHPVLRDACHAVAVHQQREPRDVVLVRVGQHDQVDAPIPGRQPLVENGQQAVGVGAAIDEHPAAAGTFHEDRVALPHVEHADREAWL